MAGWILTLGLQNLRRQINDWAPDRDHTSDGTIGDAAHAAESASGHNPDDTPGSRPEWNSDPDSTPEVRAFDCDTDFRNGATAQQLVDHILSLKPTSVLRYLIYNRRIYKASNGWKGEAYDGPSQHTEHVHFSGAFSQAADNNTTYNYRLEEIPVALTAADKTWIIQQIAAITAFDQPQADGTPTSKVGRLALSQGIPDGTLDGEPRKQAWEVIANVGHELVELHDKIDALIAAQGATG